MPPLQNVLHVDDDDDVRSIVELSLSLNRRLVVRQCSSGAEAVEVCREFVPDLLLLDLMMPNMSGEEAWDEIRRLPGLETVPAVFLTAKAQTETTERLLKKGALGVISKPFDPMQIGSKLDELWDSQIS